jgi:DNA invertase Pin-like site-specific DNA recombinase
MRYIIYARKSTEDEDKQILSIEAQLAELREFAAKEKLEIVASLCEAKTAKEPGRIVFGEMLEMIENEKADGIISWHPDRLARNSIDGGKIIHLVDQGKIKSLKFPTFWFEPTPQGLFMLQIAFGQSKYYVDNLRENVTRGMRQKIRNGVWPCKAPIGYSNNPITRGIDKDSKRAEKVRKLFELYATGNYNLRELTDWARENNFKSNLKRPLTPGKIQKILQNVFYFGLMKYKGEIYEATHKPLISKKLFDKVQQIMKEKGKPHKEKKHHFAFLGLMKCKYCGCSITAELQKGHKYYRCTKKRGFCPEKHYLREENLVEQIKKYLQKVSLSSQDTEKVLFELSKEENQAKEQARSFVQNLKTKLTETEKQLEKLLDVYLAEVITTKEYIARKQKLLNEKLVLNEQINDFEQKGLSWLEPAREFVLSLNKADKLKISGDYTEILTFLKNIGSNHYLQNRKWHFRAKIPYKLAAKRYGTGYKNLHYPKWCGFTTTLEHILAKICKK